MSDDFQYDMFLGRSSKDRAVVWAIAKRLKEAGLRLWFYEWVLPSPAGAGEGGRRPGEGRGASDRIPAKIEEGLEHSRAVPLAHRMGEGFMGRAAQVFGSDWAQLLTHSRPSTNESRRRPSRPSIRAG